MDLNVKPTWIGFTPYEEPPRVSHQGHGGVYGRSASTAEGLFLCLQAHIYLIK